MKRRILCLTLLLCGALALPPAVSAARLPDGGTDRTSGPNCHQLAEQWFGASLLEAEESGSPAEAASVWFAQREMDYLGPGSVVLPDSGVSLLDAEADQDPLPVEVPAGEAAERDRLARLDAIEEMQERLELAVTDADVTPIVDRSRTRSNPDGTVSLYVYEWTFLDYDDLTDGPGGRDTAGFGIWHKLTMEPFGDGWRTLRDEYDETDFLGVSTVTEGTLADPEASILLPQIWEGGEEDTLPGVGEDPAVSLLDASPFYPGYNPDAAAAYADKYAMSYNPAWPNYNPVGGDCANFTSQCIYAGGMPMVQKPGGWYHKLNSVSTSSARSSSWTFARELYNWMGANRGVAMTAADDTVIKGSPVFYVNKGKTAVGHAAICVGKNSAGRPVVDGHNNDVYHTPWNYSKASPAVYTVQLTGENNQPLSISGERAPSGKLGVGAGFGLRGVIRSGAVIIRVTADVLDADGNPLPECRYQEDWNDYRYDIQSDGLNDFMVFDLLPPGTYTYVVRAEDADGASEELIRSDFEVFPSEITFTGEELLPSGTLQKGNSFRLQGVINSSLPLTKIRACVCDSTGKPVSDKFVYERNWSASTYNIRTDGINSAFVFNNLPAGNYVYTVTATDASGTAKTVIEASFAVSAFTAAPDAPGIGVSGYTVSFTWTALAGAEAYEAVLSNPETGEPLYAKRTAAKDETTVLLEDVAAGTYDACVFAMAGEETRQSAALSVTVEGENSPGSGTPVSADASIAVERVYKDAHRITITTLLSCGEAERAYLAAAAYRDSQFVCLSVQDAAPAAEAEQMKITLTCPGEASFDDSVSVRLFLLDRDDHAPLSDSVAAAF